MGWSERRVENQGCRGRRWFSREAKRSTPGVPAHSQILANVMGVRDHSIVLAEPLERESAHELFTPARCVALIVRWRLSIEAMYPSGRRVCLTDDMVVSEGER